MRPAPLFDRQRLGCFCGDRTSGFTVFCFRFCCVRFKTALGPPCKSPEIAICAKNVCQFYEYADDWMRSSAVARTGSRERSQRSINVRVQSTPGVIISEGSSPQSLNALASVLEASRPWRASLERPLVLRCHTFVGVLKQVVQWHTVVVCHRYSADDVFSHCTTRKSLESFR